MVGKGGFERRVDVRMRAPLAGSLRESSKLGSGPCAKSWTLRKSPRRQLSHFSQT